MAMIECEFLNPQKERLFGNLYLPDASRRSKFPTILLCQGLSGVKKKVLPEIAKMFTREGYCALAFDYSGCGQSEGDQELIDPQKRVSDSQAALQFLTGQESVDRERIGVYGLSYGSGTAAYLASLEEKRIRSLVCVSGLVDGEDFMRALRSSSEWLAFKRVLQNGGGKRIPLTEIVPFSESFWQKYKKLKNTDESESIPEAKGVPHFKAESARLMTEFSLSKVVPKIRIPTLVIHGQLDDVVAVEDVQKVYEKLHEPKQLVIMEGCDHIDLDREEGLSIQVQHAIEWFSKTL